LGACVRLCFLWNFPVRGEEEEEEEEEEAKGAKYDICD
jgi:hypothetical protein